MGRKWGMKTAWAKSFFVSDNDPAKGAAEHASHRQHTREDRTVAATPPLSWRCTRCGCTLTVPLDAHTGRPSFVMLAEHLEGFSSSGSAPVTGVVPCAAGVLRYERGDRNNDDKGASAQTTCVGDRQEAMHALRRMLFGPPPADGCSGSAKMVTASMDVRVFVAVENPKTPANMGSILRAIGCFGASGFIFSGSRLLEALKHRPATDTQAARVHVPYLCIADMADLFRVVEDKTGEAELFESVVIAVDLIHGAIPLPLFQHPLFPDAEDDDDDDHGGGAKLHASPLGKVVVYLFGAEDGSIRQELLDHCHAAVFIPTRGSLNLAATVNAVLYDRSAAEWRRKRENEEEEVVGAFVSAATAASLEGRNKNNRTSWSLRSLTASPSLSVERKRRRRP